MARFNIQGLDAFEADLRNARNLTESEQRTILAAGGDVLKSWMQRKITSLGLVLSGMLRDSIKVFQRSDMGRPVVEVYPSGKHHVTGTARAVNASEVGFVLEYGVPSRHIRPYHWMESAALESAEETTAAMQEAFNEVLDAKGVGR